MANYKSNNTDQVKVSYFKPRSSHDLLLRYPRGTGKESAVGSALSLIQAIAPFVSEDVTFDSAKYCEADANIFTPGVWATVPGEAAFNITTSIPRGAYVEIGGASSLNTQVMYYIYGSVWLPNDAMRWFTGDNPAFTGLLNAFSDPGNGLVCIDGRPPDIRSYVNTGINDHHTGEARGN